MTDRFFDIYDQLWFAGLSGDFNPLHTDPIYARRSLFGSPLVHGVHLVLWSMNEFYKTRNGNYVLESLKVTFYKPVRAGDHVFYYESTEEPTTAKVSLLVENAQVLSLEFSFTRSTRIPEPSLPNSDNRPSFCADLSIENVSGRSGTLAFFLDTGKLRERFDFIANSLPFVQISCLLAVTRLVGMECPGLRSLMTSVEIRFTGERDEQFIDYVVEKTNKKFGNVQIKLFSPSANGKINAFIRPGFYQQPAYHEIRSLVDPVSFRSQKALIVGGSRGLGEVTAKLLAAGGAEILLTYNQGNEDADRITQEILSEKGNAHCAKLNVLETIENPSEEWMVDYKPTHIYYFATPFIFSARKGNFSERLFRDFSDFYVTSFFRIVTNFYSSSLKGVLYPSTTAIDELVLNMLEYSCAKLSGEKLCDFLQVLYPHVIFHKQRLGRMATDQTVSFVQVDNVDPVPVALDFIRHLHSLTLMEKSV